jgi:hypothetical protein
MSFSDLRTIIVLLLCAAAAISAQPGHPPRLFFSDAKISFLFPANWSVEPAFPFGPMFVKTTKQGSQAFITCEISNPLHEDRLASNLPHDQLKALAAQDMAAKSSKGRVLSETDRTLAAHNAYEVTWEDPSQQPPIQFQSLYVFSENRVYALTLRAQADSFPWLVPDFQEWLGGVRFLARRDSGALDTPALGALWIHQTGGAKVFVPSHWLVGVSDDRTLGAAYATEDKYAEMTVVVEPEQKDPQISEEDRAQARKALEKKGYKITREWEEPFHGYPAFHLAYQGNRKDRFVHAEDHWIATGKGRWLLSLEADGTLFSKLTEDFRTIINNFQFF